MSNACTSYNAHETSCHLKRPCWKGFKHHTSDEDNLLLQDPLDFSGKLFCQQDQSLRDFLHDVAAAVPVCVVVPSSIWNSVRELRHKKTFVSAGDRTLFRVRKLVHMMCHY